MIGRLQSGQGTKPMMCAGALTGSLGVFEEPQKRQDKKRTAGFSQWQHNAGVWDFMVLSMHKYNAAKIITKKRIYITQDVQLRRAELTSTRNAGLIS